MDLCQNSGALLTFHGYTRRLLNYISVVAAEKNRCHVSRCPGQISLRPAAAQSAALGLALVTAPPSGRERNSLQLSVSVAARALNESHQ